MLSLISELGQPVTTPDAEVLGRVVDLTVRLDLDRGGRLVERVVVRDEGGDHLLVGWGDVVSFTHEDVVVTGPEVGERSAPLHHDELRLVRDVLDTQVVDVAGRRLARVADVVLTRTADDRLELVGVEVGFGAVLRRLGLRRLGGRAGEDVVAWTDLHLTSERGHQVQLATPRAAVHHLDAEGLSALVSRLSTETAAEVLASAGPERAAAALQHTHPDVGDRLLRAMAPDQAESVVAALPEAHARRVRERLGRIRPLRGRAFFRAGVGHRRRTERHHRRPRP